MPHGFRKESFKGFPIMSLGALCCHGNQSTNPISPKTLCTLFPYLLIICMNFDYNWLTDFRNILFCEMCRDENRHLTISLQPSAQVSGKAEVPTEYRSNFRMCPPSHFQQCGILRSMYSDEPVQPLFKLRNSK